MADDIKESKKKITEDWLNAFPELSAFAQNKLYKIVGCCVIGLELIKLPNSEEYRPHFVIYSLFEKDLKACLSGPVIMQQIYNKKGLQFSIPFGKHANYFTEAVECLKKQIPISMYGNVTLKSLFELVDSCFNEILIKSNSGQQAKLLELEFHTALYTGSQVHLQNVLSRIQEKSTNWNMQMFEKWYGIFDIWFAELKEKAKSRNKLLKLVEINKQDRKMQQLKNSELMF